MYKFAPIAVFIIYVLLFIFGVRYFSSPSPLSLLIGHSSTAIVSSAPPPLEENRSDPPAAEETGVENAVTTTIAQEPPRIPPKPPQKKNELYAELQKIGYPFAEGSFYKSRCVSGQICAQNGTLLGINFSELYCRAAAFSKGKAMPRLEAKRTQKYESMQFWLSRKPKGFSAIFLVSDPFVLSGDMAEEKREMKGSLTLALIADWNFPCEMDGLWKGIDLPLNCVIPRNGEISCALDLKKLIASLSGIGAKATELEKKKELEALQGDLREQQRRFKNRIRERPNIEEIDLREYFQ
ncbi:MAG: hypothetical protein LBE89_00350 [Helicobacteraceae bacterium]|jgi:hypothetical protein|nr:hypothetical protein [Helicobacteraceae bacterium]